MKLLKWALVAVIATVGLAVVSDVVYETARESKWRHDRIEPVSIVRLIAMPEKEDGYRVDVRGVFVYEEENIALYLSEADADKGISANSVELNFQDSGFGTQKLRSMSHHYVRIVGRVYAKGPSQWPMSAARKIAIPVIGRIERITLLNSGNSGDIERP